MESRLIRPTHLGLNLGDAHSRHRVLIAHTVSYTRSRTVSDPPSASRVDPSRYRYVNDSRIRKTTGLAVELLRHEAQHTLVRGLARTQITVDKHHAAADRTGSTGPPAAANGKWQTSTVAVTRRHTCRRLKEGSARHGSSLPVGPSSASYAPSLH